MTTPAWGPPRSLSPENDTRSTPAATVSGTVGSYGKPYERRSTSEPEPRSSITGTPRARPSSTSSREGTSAVKPTTRRSEEHTSELQSQSNLVCRLLLEKKNTKTTLPLSPPATTPRLFTPRLLSPPNAAHTSLTLTPANCSASPTGWTPDPPVAVMFKTD